MKKRMHQALAWILLAVFFLEPASPGLSLFGAALEARAETASQDVSKDASTTPSGEASGEAEASGNASGEGSGDVSGNASGEAVDQAFTSIRVKVEEKKLVYKSAFRPQDVKIFGVCEDKSEKEIAASECTFTSAGSSVETIGNTLGKHTVTVSYKTKEGKELTADYELQVVPATVQKVTQYAATAASLSLTWDTVEGATGYQICMYDAQTGKWDKYVKGGPTNNKVAGNDVTIDNLNPGALTPGTDYEIKVRAFYGGDKSSAVYSDMTDTFVAVTAPDKVTGLKCNAYSSDSLTVAWDATAGADGYEVYRKKSGDADYIYCGAVTETSYADINLESAKTYYYKIKAYNNSRDFAGTASDSSRYSTAPGITTVSLKAGSARARITWKKITSSTGYQILVKKTGESDYTQVADIKQGTYSYIKTGLVTGTSYDVVVKPYRTLDNVSYVGDASEAKSVTPVKVSATSKKAKYYRTKKSFKKSTAYKKVAWFKENVNYKKSYVMPGTIRTNCGGFASYNMCPQAVAFAGQYVILSAYDLKGEENTVLYVMSKKTKKLLTTLILPDQVHAGGLAYDGKNIWISHGSKVAAIRYSTVRSAAQKKKAYKYVDYLTQCAVKTTASYMTYYNGMLWVGKNAETGKQPLYSYQINSKSGTPSLSAQKKIMLPDRVQGIAFLSDGSLVLSRSNLYVTSMRYYISRLDYYQPKWSGNQIKSLGKCRKVCQMPTMNEGIAVNGKYLYVCYESTAFYSASIPMDRICAFPTSSVTSGKK